VGFERVSSRPERVAATLGKGRARKGEGLGQKMGSSTAPGSLALALVAQGRTPGRERWRSSRSLCFPRPPETWGAVLPFVLYGRFGRFLVGTLQRHGGNTGLWPTRAFFQDSGDPSEASEPSELRAPLRPQRAFGLRDQGERQRAWGGRTEARWGRVAQPAHRRQTGSSSRPRRPPCSLGFVRGYIASLSYGSGATTKPEKPRLAVPPRSKSCRAEMP
jgi:hypothetical protein